MRKLIAVGFMGIGIGWITAWLEFQALDIDASIASVVLYASLGALSLLVSLTPAAIGIRESIYVLASDLIGVNLDEILQLAALDRGAKLLVMLIALIALHSIGKMKPMKD